MQWALGGFLLAESAASDIILPEKSTGIALWWLLGGFLLARRGVAGGVDGTTFDGTEFSDVPLLFPEGGVLGVIIDGAVLDDLTAQAKASPRLRMNLDLRNSPEDGSQRMLNAIEPGSVVPIHRHRKSSETVVCLRGRLVEEFYDDLERMCTEAIELSPNGPVVALNIPLGQWHTVRALESGTVIMEVKDGAYEPTGPVVDDRG